MTTDPKGMRVATLLPKLLPNDLSKLKVLWAGRYDRNENLITAYEDNTSNSGKKYFEFCIPQYFIFPQCSKEFQYVYDKAITGSDSIASEQWGDRTLTIIISADKMDGFADLCEDALRSRPTQPSSDKALDGRVVSAAGQAQGATK